VHRGGSGGASDATRATVVGPAKSGFGGAVSGAGDVDGDGYADLVVGAPLQTPQGSLQSGAATLFYGGPAGLSAARATVLSVRSGSDAQGFAQFVSTAGDVDGDGLADVVVWGGMESSDPQYLHVYLGRALAGRPASAPPTALLVFEGTSASWLGDANLLACAGDVDGDGYADLAVASPVPPRSGFEPDHVSLFFGGPGGLPPVPSRRILGPLAAADHFAISLAALDADQDGYTDLAAAAESGTAAPFSVDALVYAGSAGGLSLSTTMTNTDVTTFLEREVGSAGDVDGDGYPDLFVAFPARTTSLADAGAPAADAGIAGDAGGSADAGPAPLRGAVEIHPGGPGGASATARWTLRPPDATARAYGASLARP
jgi:hypothetical protein